MGDPAGVGAEVLVKALHLGALRDAVTVVWGVDSVMRGAAKRAGIEPSWHIVEREMGRDGDAAWLDSAKAGEVFLIEPTGEDLPAKVWEELAKTPNAWEDLKGDTAVGGAASFAWVNSGVQWAKTGKIDALVTGPISKMAWAMAGHKQYAGHTELLAALFDQPCGMFFYAPPVDHRPGMNVILVTVHIALEKVPRELTMARVLKSIQWAGETMRKLGVQDPRIGVCGLNPHAGEGGLLGFEDERVIAPAIAQGRALGFDVSGPYPADTVFSRALSYVGTRAKFDVIVAMYHDQGLIPLKTLAWDRAVNMTVGLPIVRTSPDHGTAYDIAGKNQADAGSMKAAMELAMRIES